MAVERDDMIIRLLGEFSVADLDHIIQEAHEAIKRAKKKKAAKKR